VSSSSSLLSATSCIREGILKFVLVLGPYGTFFFFIHLLVADWSAAHCTVRVRWLVRCRSAIARLVAVGGRIQTFHDAFTGQFSGARCAMAGQNGSQCAHGCHARGPRVHIDFDTSHFAVHARGARRCICAIRPLCNLCRRSAGDDLHTPGPKHCDLVLVAPATAHAGGQNVALREGPICIDLPTPSKDTHNSKSTRPTPRSDDTSSPT
jgi:hypothetical protein